MRLLLMVLLLVSAPFMAGDTTAEPPAKASGPLSAQEQLFQGDWQAHGFDSNRLEYAMTFEGRDFRARARPNERDRDERYQGYIVIRTDLEPAQIDFVVLDDSGKPGRISNGIFRVDGDKIIVKAPEHGVTRPKNFEAGDSGPIAFLRLSRAG